MHPCDGYLNSRTRLQQAKARRLPRFDRLSGAIDKNTAGQIARLEPLSHAQTACKQSIGQRLDGASRKLLAKSKPVESLFPPDSRYGLIVAHKRRSPDSTGGQP